MRPHNDIALTADPLETVAHLRASQAKWQETCQRLRAQRDAAEALAERRRVELEDACSSSSQRIDGVSPRLIALRTPCTRWRLAGHQLMATTSKFECDNCAHEAQGYTRTELEKDGWSWNIARKSAVGVVETYFILCDGCSGAAERRREERTERERLARVPRERCSHCKAATFVLPAENVVIGTEFARALPTSLCRECDKLPRAAAAGGLPLERLGAARLLLPGGVQLNPTRSTPGYPRKKQTKPDATYTIYVCANCYCHDTDPHRHCWGCGVGNGFSGTKSLS
jgi:hypothetical protein